jgi:predicted thioredoxin/glutaredoxin
MPAAILSGDLFSRSVSRMKVTVYTIIRNFACCFYGRKIRPFSLREEHRSEVFENWVLRKICVGKSGK